MGIMMKFSLEILADYVFVIRVTNETGKFTRFRIKDLETVMSLIIKEKEDITNISKGLFKALIVNDLLGYTSGNVAFLVC